MGISVGVLRPQEAIHEFQSWAHWTLRIGKTEKSGGVDTRLIDGESLVLRSESDRRTSESMSYRRIFKIGFIGSTAEILGSERPHRCSKPIVSPKDTPVYRSFARMALAIETALAIRESVDGKGFGRAMARPTTNHVRAPDPNNSSKSVAVGRFRESRGDGRRRDRRVEIPRRRK